MHRDHDWPSTVVYFPIASGSLKTEYKTGKSITKLTKSVRFADMVRVTKTMSKLKSHIDNGKVHVIIVGHGADGDGGAFAGKIGGDAGCFGTPQKDIGVLATEMVEKLGAGTMARIEDIYLWVCSSSQNGTAVCMKNAVKAAYPRLRVHGVPGEIGGIFRALDEGGEVGQAGFVEMPA